MTALACRRTAYHNLSAQTDPVDLAASQRLRGHWLRWMDEAKLSRKAALAQIGWHSTAPKWMSDGNIPEEWRLRIGRQMDTDIDGGKP